MKKTTAIFFQLFTVLLGLSAFAFLLWEPQAEGVNVGKSLSEIYFHDPFVAIAYAASAAFFVGLYKAFTLFGLAGRSEFFSEKAVKALQTIKYCALILIGFLLVGEFYIFTAVRGTDDVTGGVMMGLMLIIIFAMSGLVAHRFEKAARSTTKTKFVGA